MKKKILKLIAAYKQNIKHNNYRIKNFDHSHIELKAENNSLKAVIEELKEIIK